MKYFQNIQHKSEISNTNIYSSPSRLAAAAAAACALAWICASRLAAAIALASSACALRLAAASWRFASAMAFASFWKIRVSRFMIMERDMIVTYVSI